MTLALSMPLTLVPRPFFTIFTSFLPTCGFFDTQMLFLKSFVFPLRPYLPARVGQGARERERVGAVLGASHLSRTSFLPWRPEPPLPSSSSVCLRVCVY